MRASTLLFVVFIFTQTSFAADWVKHTIPGATCGDGSPYTIFTLDNNSPHINFKFNGGNACWNFDTCYGSDPLTNMTTVNEQSTDDFFNFHARSPVANYDRVVFSYCTGDVYVGNHQATYTKGDRSRTANHNGRDNVLKALNYLQSIGFPFSSYEQVSVYGNSAGALGALYNVSEIAPYFHLLTHKVLILDGPGLHFGDEFWLKFPAAQVEDFRHTFARYGQTLDTAKGNLAYIIPAVCNALSDWHVATLQGTKDMTMSWGFGEISPWDQERLIFSPLGMWEYTKNNTDNCVGFTPSTFKHTFMRKEENTRIKAKNARNQNKTALQFVTEILSKSEKENYK
jgi:hypothetical protein